MCVCAAGDISAEGFKQKGACLLEPVVVHPRLPVGGRPLSSDDCVVPPVLAAVLCQATTSDKCMS